MRTFYLLLLLILLVQYDASVAGDEVEADTTEVAVESEDTQSIDEQTVEQIAPSLEPEVEATIDQLEEPVTDPAPVKVEPESIVIPAEIPTAPVAGTDNKPSIPTFEQADEQALNEQWEVFLKSTTRFLKLSEEFISAQYVLIEEEALILFKAAKVETILLFKRLKAEGTPVIIELSNRSLEALSNVATQVQGYVQNQALTDLKAFQQKTEAYVQQVIFLSYYLSCLI